MCFFQAAYQTEFFLSSAKAGTAITELSEAAGAAERFEDRARAASPEPFLQANVDCIALLFADSLL